MTVITGTIPRISYLLEKNPDIPFVVHQGVSAGLETIDTGSSRSGYNESAGADDTPVSEQLIRPLATAHEFEIIR